MKYFLLFILFLFTVTVCTLFFGKPVNPYKRSNPLSDKYWLTRINKEKPDVVFIGNSMLVGIDEEYFSHLTGNQSLRMMNFGTFSSYWYALFKNMICAAKNKPKLAVFIFRDTYLTEPQFRANGAFKPQIDTICNTYEPELDWITYTQPQSTLSCFLNNYWRPYQKHYFVRLKVENHIKTLVAKLMNVDNSMPDKAVAQVFDNKNLNQKLLTKRQLGIESVASSKKHDFSDALPNSFLSHIIKLANENNIQLAFVRLKRRRDAQGSKQSESLKKYIADLKIYLKKNNVPLIDCTDIKQINESHYADGDHLTRHGAALLTDVLAQRLPDAIPDAFPVQQKEKNIIANGDFKNELKGWQIWRNPVSLKIETDFHDLNNSRNTNNKYVTMHKNGQGTGGLQTFFPVNSGSVYKVSAMVRKTNGSDASKGTLGFYMANTRAPCIQISKLSDVWTRKELTYNCHNDGVVTVYVHLDESTGPSSLDVTDVQCIKE